MMWMIDDSRWTTHFWWSTSQGSARFILAVSLNSSPDSAMVLASDSSSGPDDESFGLSGSFPDWLTSSTSRSTRA